MKKSTKKQTLVAEGVKEIVLYIRISDFLKLHCMYKSPRSDHLELALSM